MKSGALGRRTSAVEITNISKHGLWVMVDGEELFLPFSEFPWFKSAPLEAVFHVERPRPHHLYWPELDVDLTLESIRHPEKFPLVSKGSSEQPVGAGRRE
ncbi:MAG: DUF2442 domain-containing protein [bacterium]